MVYMSDENVSNYFEKEINGWGGGSWRNLEYLKKGPSKKASTAPPNQITNLKLPHFTEGKKEETLLIHQTNPHKI